MEIKVKSHMKMLMFHIVPGNFKYIKIYELAQPSVKGCMTIFSFAVAK